MVENRKEDRTARYRDRKKAEGLRKVCVWVPEKLADEVKAYAARLRKKAVK
ncbi:antitoxin MazE-like protein [Sedimenticola selenatireducens]|uniref:antitoxin MazE-like protein n=1 Tax=Sedimenticola selenatireducens TaxID=191960 RepID=UPI0037478E11